VSGKPGKGNPNGRRKYTLDHEFFSEGSLLSCYWAGFIAADGCIVRTNGQNSVKIKLSQKDSGHLEQFLQDAGSNSPVKSSTDGYCYICVGSRQWMSDLEALGITPRKTLTLEPPVGLSREQSLAFIAGLIDGDGCISFDHYTYGGPDSPITEYPTIDLCGTEPVMVWVKDFMDKNIPASVQAGVGRYKSGLSRWKASGNRALRIKEQLKDLDLPLMSRKWDRIEFAKRAVS